jgi:hypothetical protein
MRPLIVGKALNQISQDPEIESALFEILETQRIVDGNARITLLPEGGGALGTLLAAGQPHPPPRQS